MNENVKDFIKKVNEDETLKKEFNELNEKLKDETNWAMAIKTHILPFAKKAGFDFTLEDFETEGELAEDELKAVAGGGGCLCPLVGGGGGTDENDGKTYGCACVGYGHGGDGSASDCNCICPFGGTGFDFGEIL